MNDASDVPSTDNATTQLSAEDCHKVVFTCYSVQIYEYSLHAPWICVHMCAQSILQVGTIIEKRTKHTRKKQHTRGPLLRTHKLRADPIASSSTPSKRHENTVEANERNRRLALLQCLEHLASLPPSSTYAQHRRRVVEKALELLDIAMYVVGDVM